MVDANALNKSGATGTMHKNRVHGTERFPRFLLSYSFRKIHLILRDSKRIRFSIHGEKSATTAFACHGSLFVKWNYLTKFCVCPPDANYAQIRTHPNSVHAGHLHLWATEKMFCNKSTGRSNGNTLVIPFRSFAAKQWKQHFAALLYGNCEKQEVQLQVLLVYLVF